MGMLALGADGNCAQELSHILNYSNFNKLGEYSKQITNTLPYLDHQAILNFSNSLWINKNTTTNVSSDFIKEVDKYYNADIFIENFEDFNTIKMANNWISNKTNGLISNHFEESDFDRTNMALVNTMYFKASWATSFDKNLTKAEAFTMSSGQKKNVSMMNKYSYKTNYYSKKGIQAATLPFGNGNFLMTFVLPPEGSNIRDVIKTIDYVEILKNTETQTLLISLPKFEIKNKLNLHETFKKLGTSEIFTFQPWPKLTGKDNINFKVDKILQSNSISIDENGGEVASSSVSTIVGASDPTPTQFKANRPFLYILWQKSCMLPLLIGTVEQF